MGHTIQLDNEKIQQAIKKDLMNGHGLFLKENEIRKKIRAIILESTGDSLWLMNNLQVLDEFTESYYRANFA